MTGNGVTEFVKALHKLSPTGLTTTTGTVEQVSPLLVRLTGSNLLLNADDIDVLRHVVPLAGDTLFLLVSADGQSFTALGAF